MKTNMTYKVTSNEFTGRKMEFASKRAAKKLASDQRRAGWSATVIDMRTGEMVR